MQCPRCAHRPGLVQAHRDHPPSARQPCHLAELALHGPMRAATQSSYWLQGFQLGGLLAAVAAGAIGGIPFMGGEDKRTYERYHLKRDSKTRA